MTEICYIKGWLIFGGFMKRRIVLIDSNKLMFSELRKLKCDFEFFFIDEKDFLTLKNFDFDLLLISNKTKIKTPFDYLKEFRDLWSEKPVFLFIENVIENEIIFGYQLGMDGVVKWPCSQEELVAKINSELFKYHRLLNFQCDSLMSFKLNKDLFELDINGTCYKLTPLEFNILSLLKDNSNTLVKKETLLSKFRPDLKHPDKTLNTHIYNMKKKIPPLEKLIQSKKNIGYSLKLPALMEISGIKKGSSILIVDDEIDILDVLTDVAKRDFGQIFRAKNTEEALEILEKEKIDIILTDLKMLPQDGFYLIEQIQLKKLKIPTIICSAFMTKENELKAHSLGVSSIISKPFANEELLDTLSTSLSEKKK